MEVCVKSLLCAAFSMAAALICGADAAAQAEDVSTNRSTVTTPASAPIVPGRGLFREPRFIDEGLEFAGRMLATGDGGEVKNGFYPELGNMVTGAGWISAGPGYRHWLFGDRAFVDASAAISWRAYKMAQARFELPKLARSRVQVGSQVRWQDLTQVSYFGTGADSIKDNRTEYRMKSLNAVGYATMRPVQWLAINGRLGWLTGPELLPPAGSFSRDNPGTEEIFFNEPVYAFAEQPDFLYGEASVMADSRDHRGYPTRGGVYRATWSTFSDRDFNTFSFQRYEAEAAHFLPFFRDTLVVALHGWLVGTERDADQHVPLYLMPALGGHNTLRGYSDYRFHDRNLAVVNAETRIAVFEHIDAALFFDAGNVAAAFDELDLEKTSYGFGVRVHSRTATFARIDVGRSVEGWTLTFRLNDPFRLARATRRTAPIPFAP
jgi:hypothetical protein